MASVLTRTLLETKQEIPDFLQPYIPEGGTESKLKFEADSDWEQEGAEGDADGGGGAWGAGDDASGGGGGWGGEDKNASNGAWGAGEFGSNSAGLIWG
jgi:ATP-dependent RNA helicase DDX3X